MPDNTVVAASYSAGDIVAHKLSSLTPAPSGAALKSVSGIAIKAHKANTGVVWIGQDNGVAANAGFPLDPGDIITLEVLNPGNLWVLQSVAADRFSVMAVKP